MPPDARTYRIRIERHVGPAVAALFPEFDVHHEPDGTSSLIGALPDQAALHGALARVRDLGLVLCEVGPAEAPAARAPKEPGR